MWKKIGVVGVDSGQLMICDPCYIDSTWQNKDFEDIRILKSEATGKEYQFGKDFHNYNEELEGKTINQHLEEKSFKELVVDVPPTFDYNGVSNVTLFSEDQGGEIPYTAGHSGLAVAFRSGFGDGLYEVWAKYKDTGSWGKRISEVKIKLI